MKKIMLLIIALILLCIIPISAEIIIATDVTNTSILWTWNSEANITSVSIDGVIVNDWDNQTNYYRLIAPPDNYGWHTIAVHSIDDGQITSAYIPKPESPVDTSLNMLAGYTLFILAFIFITAGLFVPFSAWIGLCLALIGIIDMQHVSFWGGFIFMVLFLAGIFVAFKDMQGD